MLHEGRRSRRIDVGEDGGGAGSEAFQQAAGPEAKAAFNSPVRRGLSHAKGWKEVVRH
jgi:hypothetical protein